MLVQNEVTSPKVDLVCESRVESWLRATNEGIFNQNTNLEWHVRACETTRFGGGKTKRSSRHDQFLYQFLVTILQLNKFSLFFNTRTTILTLLGGVHHERAH